MDEYIHGEALGPRLVAVKPEQGYKLILTFNNGEKRLFDASGLLKMKVFKPLEKPDFFNSVKVQFGTVVWPQDIDYCPDTLYAESLPI